MSFQVHQSNVITAAHGDKLEIGHFHSYYGSVDRLIMGTNTSGGDGIYTVPCLMTSAMWNSGVAVNLTLLKMGKNVMGSIPYTTTLITNTGVNTTITLTPTTPLPNQLNIGYPDEMNDSVKIGRVGFGFTLGNDAIKCADIYAMNTSTNTPSFAILPDDDSPVAGHYVIIKPTSFTYANQ